MPSAPSQRAFAPILDAYNIQDKIAAMKAKTAAMNALADVLNRQKELYKQQADEAAIELAKMRAELMRAELRKAELLQKLTALKNKFEH